MKDPFAALRRERNSLLNQWINARDHEKATILVKIMDIDEQLEAAKPKIRKRKQVS